MFVPLLAGRIEMVASTRRWVLACVVLVAGAGSLGETAQSLRVAQDLFAPVLPGPSRDARARSMGPSMDSRVTRVAIERLADDTLHLNLFAGATFDARRRHAERQADGSIVWSGQVENDPLSAVTFVRAGNIVQGSIRTGSLTYSIEPVGAGPDHVIRRIDPRFTLPELPPLVPPASAARDLAGAPGLDDGSTVDVLVFYTTGARQQAGGSDAAVTARIALGIAETNMAYANSSVAQRVRLVGAELVGYQESGDLAEDLERLTADADGMMDLVHARRNASGADLVTLVVGSTAGGACGVAWVMQNQSIAFAPFAFSVTAYPCISPNYTFGHELAHNMGTAHAPEDPNAPPALPYAYGYKEPEQLFRTVMAYDCPAGCPRVLHFSNPGAMYDGKPTGTADRQHNALALNQTAPTVANFRESRPSSSLVSAPLAFTVDTAGTTVALTWDRPAQGEPVNYLVEVGSREGLADIASIVASGATTGIVQPGVPPGAYFLRVRAYDAYGPGPPSDSEQIVMTATGRCIAPAGAPSLRPAAVDGTTVALAWTPADTGGRVDHFVVGAGTRPQAADVAVIDIGSADTTFTAHAVPGVYFVRVAGLNACGAGAISNEVGIVVGPAIPGPPQALMAGIAVDRRVTLAWDPSLAGGEATSYVVEAGSAPGLSDIALLYTGGASPSFTIVAPPRRYYVRVRAVNAHGMSAPSDEIVVVVL